MQLSFHEGVGDHRTALVDVTTFLAIGKQEFKVVHPAARRLCSGNTRARDKYLSYLKQQMATHRMTERLQECKCEATSYPVTANVRERMQRLDTQLVEIQRGSKKQC